MNYASYYRQKEKGAQRIIGYQNGQDASQVTYAKQAMANAPVPAFNSANTIRGSVATNFSKIGGSIANILDVSQQNNSPIGPSCTTGVQGAMNGLKNTDTAALLIGNMQYAAVNQTLCSPSPYQIVIPCSPYSDPQVTMSTVMGAKNISINAPGVKQCPSTTDGSQLYRNNSELIKNQGLQETINLKYNLPRRIY
jgi:hypothetical protein